MILKLLFICIILIFVIFFMRNIRWFILQIRKIAHRRNQGGYVKLMQIGILTVLLSLLIGCFIYYWKGEETLTTMGVILTVLVGWLGAIIGRFFGETVMDKLDYAGPDLELISNVFNDQEKNIDRAKEQRSRYNGIIEEYEKLVDELKLLKKKSKK